MSVGHDAMELKRRGLIAEHGTSWMLTRLVGHSRALDLMFSSRRVDGDEAYRIGLADRICAPERLLDEAAREQLAVWADRNLVEIISQEGGDPAAVSFDAVSAGKARQLAVALTARQYEALALAYGAAEPPLRAVTPCAECREEAKALAARRKREHDKIQKVDTVALPSGEGAWYIMSEVWLARWRHFIRNEGVTDGTGRGRFSRMRIGR